MVGVTFEGGRLCVLALCVASTLGDAFGRTQGRIGALTDASDGSNNVDWCLAPRPKNLPRETYVHYNSTSCVHLKREDHRCKGVEVEFPESYEFGLTADMFARSRSTVGHVGRFRNFLCKLWSGQPVKVLTLCGSNCGRAYLKQIEVIGKDGNKIGWDEESWPMRFEYWLNKAFPTTSGEQHGEHVHQPLLPGAHHALTRVSAVRSGGEHGDGRGWHMRCGTPCQDIYGVHGRHARFHRRRIR